MPGVEIIRVPAVKDMDISLECPVQRKGDKEIAQKVYTTLSAASKLRRISELIEEHEATLIFVNTRQMAETLASRLKILGVNSDIHHSSLSSEARQEVEAEFKGEKIKALICTSSLELGIDIGSVDLVIQYNSPKQVSRLIQRVGRSGHKINARSKGIIIADNSDEIFESAVIIRRAFSNEVEEINPFVKPYDVLAHQIVGIVLDLGEVTKKRCFKLIKKAWIFKGLSYDEFEETLEIIKDLRLVWLTEDSIQKGRRSRKYYYENISTIPDQKRYFVKNSVTGKNVGVLDEKFAAGLEYGDLIIFKGTAWHMVSIEDREINLEPVSVISGEVPTWVGEEIPVEYHVAREAGSLRNRSPKGYSIDSKAMKCALAPITRQRSQNIPIPDHKHIVAELFSDFLVIHSTFGLKVNQTLGRFFSTILSARSGHSVSLKVDPYRIILQAKDLSTDRVEELFSTDPSFIEPLLSTSIRRTSIFKWKFVHTARRFGALSRDVDFKSLSLNRIIRAWENSLIEKEVVNDIFTSNLDIKNAAKVLEGLNEGRIGLEIFRLSDPTPLAEAGMESFTEVVLPKRAERMILRALKNRIEGKRVTLFCAYCGKWQDSFIVKNIPPDIKCGNCSARMLAPLTYKPRESIKSFRKYKGGERISRGEQKEIKRIQRLGGLFLSYGRLLPEVLAARGVGPEVAKRVLRDSRTDEELYRNILKSERNYARTKKFWD